MRRLALISVIVLAGAFLPLAHASSSAAPGPRPARYDHLAAQIFEVPGAGAIAVGMPNPRTVKVQHRLEDGDWSAPRVLFRKDGVTCGEIDGRASAGGVALLLECDTPYYDDQAPVHSQAFVTQDLLTWHSRRIRGEAYAAPAISTDGTNAAWLYNDNDYLLFRLGAGFSSGSTSFDSDGGSEAIAVDDAATVTMMGADFSVENCEFGVYDRALDGTTDHYVIPDVDPGCTEGRLVVEDDRTATGGFYTREYRYTLGREPGQRWHVTRVAPIDAPAHVRYTGPRRGVIRNVFSDARGQALVSLGSPDRRHVYGQVYDDGTGAWGPATLVYTDRGNDCASDFNGLYDVRQDMHVQTFGCGGRRILLTSADSETWTSTRIDKRPFAISISGSLLAAPGPRSITLVSPTGTSRLPVRAPHRCAVVYPIDADSVMRLHGPEGGWPTRVQRSDAGGPWRTVQRVRMPRRGACRSAGVDYYEDQVLVFLRGEGEFASFRIGRRGGDAVLLPAPF